MRRLPALAVLVLASVIPLAAPAAPDRAGSARFVEGALSPVSRRAPDAIARGYLARSAALTSGADLAETRAAVRTLGRGTLVTLEQHHAGLPVLGRAARVRVDADGRVRWARSTLAALPDGFVTTPRLTADEALAGARVAPGQPPALVVWAPADRAPRLAWRASLAPSFDGERPAQWELVVAADDGATLARRNRILAARGHLAEVYRENPIATPTLGLVTLDALPARATTLTDGDIHAVSCVDRQACVEGPLGTDHFCSFEPTVVADERGSFLEVAPSADPLDPSDRFAELMVYFHTARAYAFFRALVGDPRFELAGGPITAIANMRWSSGADCEGTGPAPAGSTLTPLDNAFYMPESVLPGIEGPLLALGQGTTSDFGLDGDVIHHELGHALVTTLAPDLGWFLPHDRGIDATPGGLVEGLPDYLASALTGGALLGEYVGDPMDPAARGIRNLDNDHACPEHLTGESHEDGTIVGGALWQLRAGLPADDRPALDRAVVAAIGGLDATSGFDAFQALLTAELAIELGTDAYATAAAVFAARGLDGCGGFVRDLSLGERHPRLFIAEDLGRDLAAAAVQFRIGLADGAPRLTIRGELDERGSDRLVLLIKPDEPIEWDGFVHDAPLAVDLEAEDGILEHTIAGPFPGAVYHLQLVSESGTTLIDDVRFSTDVPPPREPDADREDPSAEDDGGCRAVGAAAVGSHGGVLLGLIGLAWLRRRRRPGR